MNAKSSNSEVDKLCNETTNFVASSSTPTETGNGKHSKSGNQEMEHQNLKEVVEPRTSKNMKASKKQDKRINFR